MTREFSCGWETRWQHQGLRPGESSYSSLEYPAGGSFPQGLGHMRLLSVIAASPSAWVNHALAASAQEIWISGNVYLGGRFPTTEFRRELRVGWNNSVTPDLGYFYLRGINDQRIGWSWSGQGESKVYAVADTTWYFVIVHAKVDPAGVEVVEAWVNGVQEFSWTGEATVAFSSIDRLYFYGSDIRYAGGSSGQVQHRFDNFVVNSVAGAEDNDNPRQVYFVGLPVTGVGAVTQLLRGGVDSGANWNQVNEIPPDGAEWVYGGDPEIGFQDTYAATNVPGLIDGIDYEVRGVLVEGRHRLSAVDGGDGIRPLIRTYGTNYVGAAVSPGTAWEPYQERWRLNPNTSAAWSKAEVDAAEPGVEVV